MPKLPQLGPTSFPLLRLLYSGSANEAPHDNLLVQRLMDVNPAWRLIPCGACGGQLLLSSGWRGLYATCKSCKKTHTVDAESHQRLSALLFPSCPDCGEQVIPVAGRKSNYLACPSCCRNISWTRAVVTSAASPGGTRK